MKKIFTLSFLFLFSIGMMSQTVRFGVKIGGNTSKWGGSDTGNDMKYRIGYNIGATFDIDFTEKITMLSGVDFVQKGFKNSGDFLATSANPVYIQLPFHFGYKLNIKDMKLILHGGPYLGCGIAGKIKSDSRILDGTTFFDPDEGFRRIDVGMGVGAMLQLNHWFADLGFELGFIKPEKDFNAANRSIYLAAGYKF